MAVLVTRPDERGRQLVEMLSQSGVAALHLPLFTLEEGYELVNLPTRLNQLNAGDYVFLVSKSAVDFADKILKKTNNIWRKDLHFFTVGERTAQYFSCQSERNVRYPIRSESSEGLLELPEILRANNGRDFFRKQAELRGALVSYVECYRREPLFYDAEEKINICKCLGVNTIVATSLDIVQSLLTFVPENDQVWLKQCTLITVSQRIANFTKEAGWANVVISPKADNTSLLNTLLKTH